MKKKFVLFFLSTIMLALVANAQIRKIPSEVTDAFKAKFPNATNVEWKDNLTNFEASFSMDNLDWNAQFSSKGEWKETQKKINFDALPAAVKDGFQKSKYNDWTPGSVTLIQQPGEEDQYKIYAEKSSIVQRRFLVFNKSGQLLKELPGI